jgi:hypothetical protein
MCLLVKLLCAAGRNRAAGIGLVTIGKLGLTGI